MSSMKSETEVKECLLLNYRLFSSLQYRLTPSALPPFQLLYFCSFITLVCLLHFSSLTGVAGLVKDVGCRSLSVPQHLLRYPPFRSGRTLTLIRGYNIGLRLIDEFLARSGLGRCRDLRETAEVIAKVGFKMFLGYSGSVLKMNAKKGSFHLVLEDNPLIDFVELPAQYKETLIYNNILCGVIRGALEMVQLPFLKLLFSRVSEPNLRLGADEGEVHSEEVPTQRPRCHSN